MEGEAMNTACTSNRASGIGLRYTIKDVNDVELIWTEGYAVLAFRLNRMLNELNPDLTHLRLTATEPLSVHGLSYFYRLFREALPAELFSRIPNGTRLVRGPDGEQIEGGSIALRDGERAFPWCIGCTPLGKANPDLDREYMDVTHQLRSFQNDATWFEEHILKPTKAQAAVWKLLFQSWKEQLYENMRTPPTNLTPKQLDIWNVVVEAGHRLTGTQIYEALAVKARALQHRPPSWGMLKQNLAFLNKQRRVLSNRPDTNPPGYGLPEWE
jgi:hypothetical protein